MCTTDYLRRLTELSEGLMTIYIKKLSLLGQFGKKENGDTESSESASCEGMLCPYDLKLLLDDLFRKLLVIATDCKWKEYADLLDAFKKAIIDIPGLKTSKMDSDTKKSYDAVIGLLDESKEGIALDNKNNLISCRNLLYKAD